MSCNKLEFSKERPSRCWFFNNLMRELQTAQLTKMLPKELRMLICDMSIGFPVYCVGAREAELNENGRQNRRDVNCLVQKFVSEPPLHNNWTCWPCLDFLKKCNPEEWRERLDSKSIYNFGKNSKRFQKTSWPNRKTISNVQRQLSDDHENPVVIKLRFAEIRMGQDKNYKSPFNLP